jgi:hypothetical protein
VIITARQCSGGFAQPGDGYRGGPGDAGTVPYAGAVVVGVRNAGGSVIVTAGSGPGPSGSITVVVGDDVGLVVSPGDVVVVSVGLVVVGVVVVVVSSSFGPRTLVRGTQV